MSRPPAASDPIEVVLSRLVPCQASSIAAIDAWLADATRAARWLSATRARLAGVRRELLRVGAEPVRSEPVPATECGSGGSVAAEPEPAPGPPSAASPGSWSSKESARDHAIDRVVALLASFGDALADGALTEEHLLALDRLRARDGLTDLVVGAEAELLASARVRSAETFATWLSRWVAQRDGRARTERHRENRSVKTFRGDDDMGVLRAVLPPAQFDALKRTLYVIDGELQRAGRVPAGATWDQRLADALVELHRRATTAGAAQEGSLRTAVVVLIELADLLDGLGHGVTADGHAIDAGEVRRMAADAQIIPVVLGADSEPLDVGRAQRYATDHQWIALLARQGGCWRADCVDPVGTLDAHHLVPWGQGGRTDLHNLALGCTREHRHAHATGQTFRVHRGRVHITEPDGTTRISPNRRDRTPRPPGPQAARSPHDPAARTAPPGTGPPGLFDTA